MKSVNGHQIIELFEQFSPKKYAMEGDKIGLQIGDLSRHVQKVLVTLDVTKDVVAEAIQKGVQLIIAHHPPIFRPLQRIEGGSIFESLIKHDISVYAAHTNLDVAVGGVNDLLSKRLGLQNTKVLVPTYEIPLKKLVVFVPIENADEVREALGKAGAGHIGEYSYCSFTASGEGRFLPGNAAHPYLGTVGKLETVAEQRIETIYPVSIEKQVLNAMFSSHPYEEVAYDIYPLELKGESLGLGRVGTLKEPMSLREFAEFVKKQLDVSMVRVVGRLNDTIKKVAVLGGDGNKYYRHAMRHGADVYVTGDLYFHTAQDALQDGLNVIDPGHHVEKVMIKGVAEKLEELVPKQWDVQFLPSEINTDPFQII
ncbi:MAG TPA: Nif3-like dinuclear metal center hexameric protein [Bacillus sp. (in: firmicutes)]|uniref:Nif3-like dinuclear metal center hexameric protein n=1 Tax=Bacillus litorisediminis TaxID=2922713 RepID=UPI001FAEE42D|nr:Nif3-like dinuclear metal center hexameric protein [Bacillus litorisediminis]HWO77668.1 Nif3-like dinuclear metal center hexameric protein [Bacillus sp. (in: firmicutes)]